MVSKTPLKVLFCTDGIFPHMVGGMQRHSRLLVEALAKTGEVELTVLHPHMGVQVFEGMAHITEIALPPLPGKRYYLRELHAYSKQVLSIARQYPDHLIYSQGLSVWAGLDELAPRLIVNPHGLEPYQTLDTTTWLKTLPFRLVFNRIFRKAAHTISLGGHLSDILQQRMGSKKNRLVVLPNATNPVSLPSDHHKQRGAKLRFLFAGRFAANKGIDTLLSAAQILHQRGFGPRFQLALVGKGPLFESMYAQYDLPGVHFLGFVPDEGLDALYLDAHVFVLPTLFEGMPTVVLEAMARAMPILVTDVGATLELVDPSNGIILPKRDPEALATAMQQMIELPDEQFTRLSIRSLEKFKERFTWEAVAGQHLDLFKRMKAAQTIV